MLPQCISNFHRKSLIKIITVFISRPNNQSRRLSKETPTRPRRVAHHFQHFYNNVKSGVHT